MIGAIVLILVLFMLNQPVITALKGNMRNFDRKLMDSLYWYHVLFAGIYYGYAIATRSDSFGYFQRPQFVYNNWFEAFGTGTPFIDFVAYPFINYFFFSYEMMMVLFSYLGYLGFVFFYKFFKENIKFTHKWQGYDIISILLFLPNMHFWTASLGKGSIIFLGLGMATYGLSKMTSRKLMLAFGMLIIYFVRPHIFLIVGVSILLGIITGREKIPLLHKLVIFTGSIGALVLLYDQILAFAKLDSENLVGSYTNLADHRAAELAKAGSGLDTSNYPLPLKLVTFWFRPLFFDAPGVLGIFVSVENVFYLILTAKLFQKGAWRFIRRGTSVFKICIYIFLLASLGLSSTLSNLGIIIRQKSMVMYFLFFAILSFMDYKKGLAVARRKKLMEMARENESLTPAV